MELTVKLVRHLGRKHAGDANWGIKAARGILHKRDAKLKCVVSGKITVPAPIAIFMSPV